MKYQYYIVLIILLLLLAFIYTREGFSSLPGTVTNVNGNWQFNPQKDYSGIVTIPYILNDTFGNKRNQDSLMLNLYSDTANSDTTPTSAAPLPTSAAPLPTNTTPTSAAPLPTSAAPLPTSAAPLPTSAAPSIPKTCSAGNYLTTSGCLTCPANSYCPAGSTTPTLCPTGGSTDPGAINLDSCFPFVGDNGMVSGQLYCNGGWENGPGKLMKCLGAWDTVLNKPVSCIPTYGTSYNHINYSCGCPTGVTKTNGVCNLACTDTDISTVTWNGVAMDPATTVDYDPKLVVAGLFGGTASSKYFMKIKAIPFSLYACEGIQNFLMSSIQTLIMQSDGNLVLYSVADPLNALVNKPKNILWSSKTAGNSGAYANFTGSGIDINDANGTNITSFKFGTGVTNAVGFGIGSMNTTDWFPGDQNICYFLTGNSAAIKAAFSP